MFPPGPDRGPPSALRGWLSDVYFASMLDKGLREKSLEALSLRLGAKATIDDPLHGRAAGLPSIVEHLKKTADWLDEHSATYERVAFTMGVDRDVTEGTFSLTFESKTVELPIAVVAERRRSREVELRVYHAMQPISGVAKVRPPLVEENKELVLPTPVSDFLAALGTGKTDAIEAAFEAEGTVRDARGLLHGRKDGALRTFFDALVAGGAFGGGLVLELGGVADGGRTCALEYTLVKARGSDVPRQAGLMLFERGDSGLLRTMRIYGEFDEG